MRLELRSGQCEAYVFWIKGDVVNFVTERDLYRPQSRQLRTLSSDSLLEVKQSVPDYDAITPSERRERVEAFKEIFASRRGACSSFENFELEANDGRKLVGKVKGRDDDSIQIVSEINGVLYDVPYSSLSVRSAKDVQNSVPFKFMKIETEHAFDNNHKGEEENAIYDLSYALGLVSSKESPYPSKSYPLDLSGDLGEAVSIYGDITYLMDIDEVVQLLRGKVGIPDRLEIICPGFPDRQFQLYLFSIDSEYRDREGYNDKSKLSGYNSIGVAVDLKGQVVAVQLNRTTDVDSLIPFRTGRVQHTVYNFLEVKKRATPNANVRIESRGGSGDIQATTSYSQSRSSHSLGRYTHIRSAGLNSCILEIEGVSVEIPLLQDVSRQEVHMIDSFFYTYKSSSDGRSLNYSKLYMPSKMANLLRHNIVKNWIRDEDFAASKVSPSAQDSKPF